MTEEGPDRGLQAERTELAWVRTALSCGGLAVVATHLADDKFAAAGAVLVGAVVAVPGLVGFRLRIGRLRRGWSGPPRVAGAGAVRLLVATVVLADLIALATLVR